MTKLEWRINDETAMTNHTRLYHVAAHDKFGGFFISAMSAGRPT